MWTHLAFTSLTISLVLLAGCGFRPPRATLGRVKVAGVTVEFKPIPESTGWIAEADGSEIDVTADYYGAREKVTVRIEDGELTVNGRGYGSVEKGDHVLIDNGVVRVNGEKRSPQS
jgi:hypothetical protein